MVTLGGAKIEGEDLLTLFTCFAVATTRDANNTERLYDTAECKGVAGQLIKRKKSDYLDSTEFKTINIHALRGRWRNQAANPEVDEMRGSVEDKKGYYLDRASELLQLYQSKEITDGKKNKWKKTRNEKKMDQAPDDDGFGHFSISGYDHAQTHGDTTSLKSQESDDADPQAPSDDADAVSKAVGDMSLTVTSPPVGPYETRGGSVLQDPAQEYAYTDPTTGVKHSLGPGPSYHINRDTAAYSRPPPPQQSPYYQGSGPQNETIEESSQSESEEDSNVKIGHDRFVSSRNYLGSKGKNRCTGRGFPPSHQDDDYGAPGSHKPFGGAPSPHAIENFEAWQSKALEAAAKEASTSSGKSKSPAHHEERREREKERERKDQPAKSRGSTSGGGSKQKTDKDNQPATSHRKKSGGSSKPKDTSKDDTRGGGRRRERQR